MSPFRSRPACAALLLAAACAPRTAPLPDAGPAPVPAVAPDTVVRPVPPRVPVPASFVEALQRGTRSAIGAPGERYWQQRVRYRIEAELDPQSATLRAAQRVVYHNRSPETLRSVVLNLYQNVFSPGVPRNRYVPVTGGVTLERVAAQGQGLRQLTPREISVVRTPRADAPAGYAVEGTLARLVLPRPLPPGDSLVLEVEWHHRVPPAPSFRTGWEEALGARAFHVAQWYPQIATFDDLQGWDATPYLGDGEFYLEYGDFDVSITVPAGYLVGATGVLQNPEDVLTDEARRRLAAALRSDSVTAVVTEADLAADNVTQPARAGQLTWRFRAENVRDFGFATSRRYVWDATRALIPDGRGGTRAVEVHALYRPGAPHWQRAARFGQHSIRFFSERLIPYVYPQVTIAEGPIGGMEYPQLVFIGKPARVESLHAVIAHEVGHQWFPMMVGSDEAAYAWMDEGVTTFIEGLAASDFYQQPDTVSFAGDVASYLGVAGTTAEVPLMRHTDLVSPYGARGVAAYTKPAVLLRSLRAVLGDSVFHRALNTYAREWLFKHPSPWDFFHTMERVSGRDLDWFVHPWWFETGVLDQAIERVEAVESGARVTVRNLARAPAPTLVVGTTAAGERVTERIPADTWLHGVESATVTLRSTAPIVRVELDPERLFPDVDRGNNVWPVPIRR